MPKYIGACTRCGEMVFDVLRQDESGRPTKLGKPFDEAYRVHFALADGSTMALTFCGECERGLLPADYPVIWNHVMGAFAEEIERCAVLDPARHDARIAAAKRLFKNIPVGVVSVQRWSEVPR